MKHIILINTENKAGNYDIITYINQIIGCLFQNIALHLAMVNINLNIKKAKSIEQASWRFLSFSKVNSSNYSTYADRYDRNISYLLSLLLRKKTNYIFHFNYLQHTFSAFSIKERFIEACILLIINYYNWCAFLKDAIFTFCLILLQHDCEQNNSKNMVYSNDQRGKTFFESTDKVICFSKYTVNLLHYNFHTSDSNINLLLMISSHYIFSWQKENKKREQENHGNII